MCVCVCVVRRMNLDSNLLTQQYFVGTSLVVQWLSFHAYTAVGMGSIAGLGTKIPDAMQHDFKKKKKAMSEMCILH